VGGRGLKQGVLELKIRRSGEVLDAPVEGLVEQIQQVIADEIALIEATVVEETL